MVRARQSLFGDLREQVSHHLAQRGVDARDVVDLAVAGRHRNDPSTATATRAARNIALLRSRRAFSGLVLGVALAASSLAAQTAPADAVPVVIVPGVTGSKLNDEVRGVEVWGSAGSFFAPKDRGHGLALPIRPEDEAHGPLVPSGTIFHVRLLTWTKEVYRPLRRALEHAGYRLGELERPDPHATGSSGRVYATIMVTIDLARFAAYFREPADAATADRPAASAARGDSAASRGSARRRGVRRRVIG